MQDVEAEIEAALADLEKTYWILSEDQLYVKMGAKSIHATAYYTHRDPAGTAYWQRDSSTVSPKEFKSLGDGWSCEPAPLASEQVPTEVTK